MTTQKMWRYDCRHAMLLLIILVLIPEACCTCNGDCTFTQNQPVFSSSCSWEVETDPFNHYVKQKTSITGLLPDGYTFDCNNEDTAQCPPCGGTEANSANCKRTDTVQDPNGNPIVARGLQACHCMGGYEGLVHSTGGSYCSPCVQGTYKSGMFVDDYAQEYEKLGFENFFMMCQDCPWIAGYQSTSSMGMEFCDTCVIIPATYTQNAVCCEGFNVQLGLDSCRRCGPNFYANEANTTCLACPANSRSQAGSYSQDDCKCIKGYEPSESSTCEECDKGKYGVQPDVSQHAVCVSCPVGTYSDATGMTACTSCPAGKTSPTNTKSGQGCLCIDGYKGASDYTCEACEEGKYGNALNGCDDCLEGTYSDATGQADPATCLLCPNGTTSDRSNPSETLCYSCTAGKYSVREQLFTKNEWLKRQMCENCEIGKYSHAGSSACLLCSTGKYAAVPGLSSCHDCEAGKWSDKIGSNSSAVCQACPPGTYSERVGANSSDQCIPCPAGTYSGDDGLDSEQKCIRCSIGTYSTSTGSTSASTCQNCSADPGYFCNMGSSNQSGELCHAGYRCPGGSANQEACPPGTFAAAGSSICSACTPGSYSDTYARGACVNCSENHTSPYYSENASSCFAFNPTMQICPPGFFQDATDQRCKNCTHIGNLDEYEIHWRRALRYTHYRTPGSFSGFYPDGNTTQYMHLLQQEKDNRQTFEASDRFSIHPDRLARHCGLTHDAVVCPHGFVYDPSSTSTSPSQCKLPLANVNTTRTDCLHGTYFNTTDQTCHTCPRNLTTLHDGASGVAACLFCDPAFYLDSSGEDEACSPCRTEETCDTTQAFGGARAHRMSSCSIPCGPEHMHEDNESTYQCFFSRCMHEVRAQDIHPCVFQKDGTVQTNASASPCHPYFVPLAPNWVQVARSHLTGLDPDTSNIFPSAGYLPYEIGYNNTSPYISKGNERVQAARQKRQNLDWYYLLFTTNTVRNELDKDFVWPHIQANRDVGFDGVEKNSENVIFDEILHDAGLLFVKDTHVLHDTAAAMNNGSQPWPELRPYKNILLWTDLVRHAYEFYQEHYVKQWVDEQCSNLRRKNHNEMYHCHIKAFADKPAPIQWRLTMATTSGACSLDCEAEISTTCGRNENDIKEQLFNQTRNALTQNCILSHGLDQVTFDDLQHCLQGIRIDLPGIDEDINTWNDIDSCLWQEWVQDFTGEHALAENISAICGNNTGACSNGNWPWLCYNTCKTYLDGSCPEIDLVRDTNMDRYAVLKKTIYTNLYLNSEPYMADEAQFLNKTQGKFCELAQFDRQAMLRQYAPEFPGGRFFTFLTNLRDKIKEYWDQHRYTCTVAFDDNATHTYPCIFQKTTGGDYEISFVDHAGAENYTLTVTYRAENGVLQNITHVEKVDQETTRPFCQIASPVEFDMVRESLDFL